MAENTTAPVDQFAAYVILTRAPQYRRAEFAVKKKLAAGDAAPVGSKSAELRCADRRAAGVGGGRARLKAQSNLATTERCLAFAGAGRLRGRYDSHRLLPAQGATVGKHLDRHCRAV